MTDRPSGDIEVALNGIAISLENINKVLRGLLYEKIGEGNTDDIVRKATDEIVEKANE